MAVFHSSLKGPLQRPYSSHCVTGMLTCVSSHCFPMAGWKVGDLALTAAQYLGVREGRRGVRDWILESKGRWLGLDPEPERGSWDLDLSLRDEVSVWIPEF